MNQCRADCVAVAVASVAEVRDCPAREGSVRYRMQLELLVRGISLATVASEPHSTVVHNSCGRRERLGAVWLDQVCAWLKLWAVGSCEGWCNNSKPDREDIPKIGGRSSNRMQHRSPRTGI